MDYTVDVERVCIQC